MSLFDNTTVAIFAGGKSSRFGSPKIKAKIGDQEFGQMIIMTLKRAGFTRISLIGGGSDDAARWGVDFHQDIYPESGPLGALLTALQNCRTSFLMTLPCDVPYIDEETCQRLGNLAPGIEVLVARTDTPQWLCSTWRQSTYGLIDHEYKLGERAIHRVVEKLKFEFVDAQKETLLNVNRKSQLKDQPKTT